MTDAREDPPETLLVVLNGPLEGQRFRAVPGLRVGRLEEADIVLADAKVSRLHAQFERRGTAYYVVDLGSHNGVEVNGRRVESCAIRHGDVVQIGRTEIGVIEPRHDSHLDVVTSSTLPPEAIRRWDEQAPPPIATLESDAFLRALGVPLPSASILHENEEFRRLVDKTRNFAVLSELSHSLERAENLETVLGTAVTYLFWVIGADRGYVLLRDAETASFEVVLARHRNPDDLAAGIAVSRTIVESAIQERQAVVSSNASTDARFKEAPSVELNHIGSVLCIPLVANDTVIGVIQLDRHTPARPFTHDDLELVQVLASFLSLRVRNAQLFDELRQQYDELQATHTQLQLAQKTLLEAERLTVVGRLAAGMAHEIRNWALPLASAELLLEHFPGDDRLIELVELIGDARDGITSVVDELWQLSKDLPPNLSPARRSLHDAVETAIRIARCDPSVRIHTISRVLEPMDLVTFDENHLLRVLINLLRNAGQAMDQPGRIEVLVGRDPEHPECARIAVKDHGCGIDADNLRAIWEPFFTTKGEYGLGLGLDLCRRIVEAHGGTIACDSVLGRGTTMIVRLPLESGAEPS